MRRWAALVLVLLVAGCGAPPDGDSPEETAPSATASSTAVATHSAAPSAASTAEPDPLAWVPLEVAGPPAREDHTWTVAGDAGEALLFGGRDGATVFDDLWSYDLATDAWSQLAPTGGGPDARFGHEAVWVDGVGLVVFAGQSGAAFFNDLWAYEPESNAWTELPAGGDVPVPRYGTCAGLGQDGRLWISHGFTSDGVRFSDTVAYDFSAGAWTDETPDGTRPVERCLHGCWWTDDGRLVLYAGQTTGTLALGDRWALAGAGWSEVGGDLPPERNLYGRARLDGATIVFGGQALDTSYRNDLWRLADAGGDAVRLEPDGDAPPPRAGAEIVADAGAGRVLLFGGRDADGALADLWALNGVGADD
jgi:galactose oxidase-like protein